MLQETLLRRTSRVFSAALNNEHLGEGNKGALKFPKDDVAAWKALIFWIFDKKYPEENLESRMSRREMEEDLEKKEAMEEELQVFLIHCWIVGDKYDIPDFQDLAMLELLHHLNQSYMLPLAAELAASGTAPGSKLRLIAAQDIALVATKRAEDAIDEYESALSVSGFALEVIKEIKRQEQNCEDTLDIGCKNGIGREDSWKKFMVAGGPDKHWIHNENKDRLKE